LDYAVEMSNDCSTLPELELPLLYFALYVIITDANNNKEQSRNELIADP
jgi:hypothetical protein